MKPPFLLLPLIFDEFTVFGRRPALQHVSAFKCVGWSVLPLVDFETVGGFVLEYGSLLTGTVALEFAVSSDALTSSVVGIDSDGSVESLIVLVE